MVQTVVFVLYDSITNSIFEGQILASLLKKITQQQCIVHIISFERALPSLQKQTFLKQYEPSLIIHYIKRMPFLGTFSLFFEYKQLQKILGMFDTYELIARGPLAGLCAYYTSLKHCQSFTIQARGLLTEEYRYTHQTSSRIMRIIHTIRSYHLKYYEKKLFKNIPFSPCKTTIETISTALTEYLSQQFFIHPSYFTQATEDIPQSISATEKKNLRVIVRKNLKIPLSAPVYVYNGSAKPWQCPQETILYFKACYAKNHHSILLILTQETLYFKQLCIKLKLPESSYHIKQVPHTIVMNYLCAADIGIILRENHIINWISRPTKVLEYQAAGLSLYHNNTIAMLAQKQ